MKRLARAISNAFGVALFLAFLFGLGGLALAIWHPDSPLPDAWNPVKPLRVADPVTPLTRWKLGRTLRSGQQCLTALQGAGAAQELQDLRESDLCGIANRVTLSRVGTAEMAPVETTCAIALRLAMWETHGLQTAAQRHLGARIVGLRHLSSYNCRPIRSEDGQGDAMSTHAQAEAIDITGVQLSDGRTTLLQRDWAGRDETSAFWQDARNSACRWFVTVLGPDFNALHGDHFHLQSVGWGLCR